MKNLINKEEEFPRKGGRKFLNNSYVILYFEQQLNSHAYLIQIKIKRLKRTYKIILYIKKKNSRVKKYVLR